MKALYNLALCYMMFMFCVAGSSVLGPRADPAAAAGSPVPDLLPLLRHQTLRFLCFGIFGMISLYYYNIKHLEGTVVIWCYINEDSVTSSFVLFICYFCHSCCLVRFKPPWLEVGY